jgi:hypothetical protein
MSIQNFLRKDLYEPDRHLHLKAKSIVHFLMMRNKEAIKGEGLPPFIYLEPIEEFSKFLRVYSSGLFTVSVKKGKKITNVKKNWCCLSGIPSKPD